MPEQDIIDRNKQYTEDLKRLRSQLMSDFASKGIDSPVNVQLADDDSLSLSTLFYIMFTSCGGIHISDGEPRIVKSGEECYKLWDGSLLCLASADEYLLALALGLAEIPSDDCFVLCAPGVISVEDLSMFTSSFDIVYSEHGNDKLFAFGRLGTYCTVSLPDWARYIMAQHALDLMTLDIINERRILCFRDRYSFGMTDELPRSIPGIVNGLLMGEEVDDCILYRPDSMDDIEPWRLKAIQKKFVLSPEGDADMRKIYDICCIWTAVCSQLSIASAITSPELSNSEIVEEKLHTLGEVLGIRSAIDAYMAGVSVEDIIA